MFRKKHFKHRQSGGGRKFVQKRRKDSVFKDISKFVNKATHQETVEYKPVNSFQNFELDSRLEKNVLRAGYKEPSPIQDQAIPHVLNGRDVVGLANTGTGKTVAFVVPLLDRIIKNRDEKVLIVAPTRELAIQINQEIVKFASGLSIYSVSVVGGLPIFRQISDLKRKHNFVIGTPGRIKDLIQRGVIKIKDFNKIVLDEADRMLDMGFVNDMRFLMSALPEERQILFFSATVSGEINTIIKEYLKDPISISVKTRDTSSTIDQDVVYTQGNQKINILHDLLSKPEFDKVLIFGRTKRGVEKLSGELIKRGIKADSIHGNKNHNQRQRALKSFKEKAVTVLVATDVAARGLDISDISHVINYELPSNYEDYIHRIGRTGRGGKSGKALTFID